MDSEEEANEALLDAWRAIVHRDILPFCNEPSVPVIVLMPNPAVDADDALCGFRVWAYCDREASSHFMMLSKMLFPDYVGDLDDRVSFLMREYAKLPPRNVQPTAPGTEERYVPLQAACERLMRAIHENHRDRLAFIAYERPEDKQWVVHGHPHVDDLDAACEHHKLLYRFLLQGVGDNE